MSKDTLIAKYETLPVVAQKQVETFNEFSLKDVVCISQYQKGNSSHSSSQRLHWLA